MFILQDDNYAEAIEYCNSVFGEKFFIFELAYVPVHVGMFAEINRFQWESKHEMERFKNYYEGKVIINLTLWNNNDLNEYFDSFLYFITDNQDKYEPYFIVEGKCSRRILKHIKRIIGDIDLIDRIDKKPQEDRQRIGFIVEDDEDED